MCSVAAKFFNIKSWKCKRSNNFEDSSKKMLAPESSARETEVKAENLLKANKILLLLHLLTLSLAIFAIVYFHAQAQQTKLMFMQCSKINQGLLRKKRAVESCSDTRLFDLPLFRSNKFISKVATVLILMHGISFGKVHNPAKSTFEVKPIKIEHTCKCDVALPSSLFPSDISPEKYLHFCRSLRQFIPSHKRSSLENSKPKRIRHSKKLYEAKTSDSSTTSISTIPPLSTVSPLSTISSTSTSTTLPTRTMCKLEIIGNPVFQGDCPFRTNTWVNTDSEVLWIMQQPSPIKILKYDSLLNMDEQTPKQYYLPYATVSSIIHRNGLVFYVKSRPYELVAFDFITNESKVLSGDLNFNTDLDVLYSSSNDILIDLALDQSGMWIILKKADSSYWSVNHLEISEDTYLSTNQVNIPVDYQASESMIICGLLYVIESSTDKFSSIKHAYSLWDSGREHRVDISWMNPQAALVSVEYDPKQQKIHLIDGSGLYLSPIRLISL